MLYPARVPLRHAQWVYIPPPYTGWVHTRVGTSSVTRLNDSFNGLFGEASGLYSGREEPGGGMRDGNPGHPEEV